MLDNPYLTLPATTKTNAVCAMDGLNEQYDATDRIYKYYFAGCSVTFVSSSMPYKRDSPQNWQIEGGLPMLSKFSYLIKNLLTLYYRGSLSG